MRREPWLFDNGKDGFYEALCGAVSLRYRLLPYIYSWAYRVWKEDKTFLRMLAFDFMQDEKALDIGDQYMFGESILVCPVTEPMYYGTGSEVLSGIPEKRTVYLPAGCDGMIFIPGSVMQAGSMWKRTRLFPRIPLFVKAGSILPMAEAAQNTARAAEAEVEYRIYAGADCSFYVIQGQRRWLCL